MKKQLFSMVIALMFLCFIILPVAAANVDEKASVFPVQPEPASVIPTPEFPTVLVPLGLIGLIGLFVVVSRRS
jgi:uncharacterized alpha/beta hydrolase family protein